mmetsp:Transcript_99493/g.290467  ORF Transcript_99493/g.290467 Transcript_99493/m.290467 type:complete len:227 (+) Transcript_99493:1294-1974(+)
MRKHVPSSVVLLKPAATCFTILAASGMHSVREWSWPRGASPPADTSDGFQLGKRKLARSGSKLRLRKWSLRCCLKEASSLRSARSFKTCARLVSGGAKNSHSSRLSHSCGLNRSLSMALSSSLKAELERFFQKALPTNSSPPQLPSGAKGSASATVSKSNLSRLRSTPLGTPGGAPGTSSGISANPVRAWIRRWERAGARATDTLAVGTRPTATRCIWSRPISTPP